MGIKKVELLRDKIRKYLLSGYSMTATERELGLTRNDIQRYYERITGEDPKKLVEEAKENQILGTIKRNDLNPIIAKGIQESESPGIIKKIEDLENRIKRLEKLIKENKSAGSINKNIPLSNDFIVSYNSGEKKLYSIRILASLKEKLIKEAKKNNIPANQLINMILFEYFNERK